METDNGKAKTATMPPEILISENLFLVFDSMVSVFFISNGMGISFIV